MYRNQKVLLLMFIVFICLMQLCHCIRLWVLEAKFEDASTHVCVIKETKEDSMIVEMSR